MMEWLTLKWSATRFDWSHDHLGWTIRTWRRVHWSDESRFLLRPTDGRAWVWRQRNTSCQDNHILGTTCLATSQAMELSEQPLAVKNVVQFELYVA
jgi:hypothetical protein